MHSASTVTHHASASSSHYPHASAASALATAPATQACPACYDPAQKDRSPQSAAAISDHRVAAAPMTLSAGRHFFHHTADPLKSNRSANRPRQAVPPQQKHPAPAPAATPAQTRQPPNSGVSIRRAAV